MTDNAEQLRTWAIEQAIKHHGGTGVTMETLIGEAQKLMEFVRPEPVKPKAE